MKKIMTIMAMLVFAIGMFAKDIKTVVFTTLPQMHCENCENKIKGNLRFEKGIKDIQTSVPDQKVTIQYDADKTNPEKIAKGFAKIGYEATVVNGGAKKTSCGGCDKSGGCKGCCKSKEANNGGCCKSTEKKDGGCCKAKAENKEDGGCCKK